MERSQKNELTGNEIRERFLRYFETKGHRRVHSSSLVPANDPTLLFTNAGMNQFKDLFLGAERRDYSRATTSQKCVRAGGKHNDLENVGFTRRHHTFFEMLGNFSFGDYFKREAIKFAWELITGKQKDGCFEIPVERLYVTIFEGTEGVPRDDEAEKFWIEAGVAKNRIYEFGLKDNFWQMGETGPCGPCSEIFYDMGIDAAETPGVELPFGQDEARYVEIWNLVFMQFDRMEFFREEFSNEFVLNKPFENLVKTGFRLVPLPKPCVDTGAGLERLAAVLQGKVSNFETDLFMPLIERAAELTLTAYGVDDNMSVSLRVIADHVRAATFLISDGVIPSNERRGYVLRKILRRAIRHGRWLMKADPFLHLLVPVVRDEMRFAYPELADSAERAAMIIEGEERQFSRTLVLGSQQLLIDLRQVAAAAIDENRGRIQQDFRTLTQEPQMTEGFTSIKELADADWNRLRAIVGNISSPTIRLTYPGSKAFRLFETFGLPPDFQEATCQDVGIGFDHEGFEAARAEEQARARASWKGGSQKTASPAFRDLPKTTFEGYSQLNTANCEVLAIIKDGAGVPAAKAGDQVEVVLNQTSFYGDSGGQTGDSGFFLALDGNSTVAEISGCVLPVQGVRAHKALLKQPLAVGDHVTVVVDQDRRNAIKRNHTGTHLIHAALRQVLGTHVKQAGSAVHPERFRFDFSHFAPVADEELAEIETIVNSQVLADTQVESIEDVPIDVAVNEYHAMALFGEKYGDKVRVIRVGDFSTELCGGTHVRATGEIGLVKILREGSVSSGVRRLEAISGMGSLDAFQQDYAVWQIAAQFAPIPAGSSLSVSLKAKVAAQEEELKRLRRELEEARMKSAAGALDEAMARRVVVKGTTLVTLRADALERGQLRTLVDNLKQKLGEGVVVVASAQPEDKVALIAGVTAGLTKRIQAGKLVGAVAKLVNGSGGGKPEIAEAGGKDQTQIDAALEAAPKLLSELLG